MLLPFLFEGLNFASFVLLYLYVPDEGSLLPKYRDCTTYNDFQLYIVYIYIYTQYIYIVYSCKKALYRMQSNVRFKLC